MLANIEVVRQLKLIFLRAVSFVDLLSWLQDIVCVGEHWLLWKEIWLVGRFFCQPRKRTIEWRRWLKAMRKVESTWNRLLTKTHLTVDRLQLIWRQRVVETRWFIDLRLIAVKFLSFWLFLAMFRRSRSASCSLDGRLRRQIESLSGGSFSSQILKTKKVIYILLRTLETYKFANAFEFRCLAACLLTSITPLSAFTYFSFFRWNFSLALAMSVVPDELGLKRHCLGPRQGT